MDLQETINECYATAKEKGWWDGEQNIPEKIALMHSELSEALEEWRAGKGLGYYIENGKPEGTTIELVDVLVRIFDFAGHYGLDLEEGLRLKMAYNKTRPYKHGNKLC